ncbi:FHA domain-containing protein [Microbacterium sp. NIBRBAC000506063]|uniref:FHA domain-containing protein n=1 Tax=Microbacterium sp. NIBRBAC000506063 TaxID=2734618 RepID=UPI001BB5D3B6|nr:FHA domain-containing protein [Microbacterium sp. NIBRBAC000506063]QTV80226.1 FHA domain-containing protein [Microbacterium sp. NIBRBAC000506063]
MAHYRAGDWHLLVTAEAALLVAPDTPASLVHSLWERLQSGSGLAGIVDTLVGSGGASFTSIPPFAAALADGGGVRIAVRGPLEAHADAAGATERVTGENVTTWSERYVADATQVTLSVSGSDAAEPLPLLGGVVRASSVVFEVPADAAGAGPFDRSLSSSKGTDRSVVPEPTPAAPEPALRSLTTHPRSLSSSKGPRPRRGDPAEETPVGDALAPTEAIELPADEEPAPISEVTLIPTETVLPGDGEGETEDGDEPEDAVDIFDQLFADTVHSPKAVTPPAPVAPPAPPLPAEGDHDGATISLDEARRLRKSAPPATGDAPTAVLPVAASARIRLSTGQEVTLDRTVIIGRRPRSTRASGTDLPHLVAVESPQQDISRNHLEIRPEGDTVVVIDLHTTNGSTLLRPGADPVRLHPGEQTLVLGGDVIDLGDGVTVAFEGLL